MCLENRSLQLSQMAALEIKHLKRNKIKTKLIINIRLELTNKLSREERKQKDLWQFELIY
jgi:hypothetical protein